MKLGSYLAATGQTQEQFARKIGRSQSNVARYVGGNRIPRPATMRRITAETGGQVTHNDFYADDADAGQGEESQSSAAA